MKINQSINQNSKQGEIDPLSPQQYFIRILMGLLKNPWLSYVVIMIFHLYEHINITETSIFQVDTGCGRAHFLQLKFLKQYKDFMRKIWIKCSQLCNTPAVANQTHFVLL